MIDAQQVVKVFLKESNAIEGVHDARSLTDALKAWDYLVKQEEITTAVVLTTHRLLMEHQSLEKLLRGHYRKQKVWVGRHEALSHLRISEHMSRWIEAMNVRAQITSQKGEKTLEFISKQLHVEYEHVHPFVDGNGRTGRMFMNWWRLRNGLRIYVVKEVDRFKYYKWFAV